MGTLLYLLIAALCIAFVKKAADEYECKNRCRIIESDFIRILGIVLCGLILAAVLTALFKVLFIPLLIIGIVLYIFYCRK